MIGHLVRVSTRVFHGRERPAPSATLAGVIRARTALLMTLSEENKRAATKLAVPKFAWSAPEIADGPFLSPTRIDLRSDVLELQSSLVRVFGAAGPGSRFRKLGRTRRGLGGLSASSLLVEGPHL
jgi:hypothetical protein